MVQNETDVYRGLKAAKEAGLKVVRTWGFYEKNATFDPLGLPQYGGEGAGPSEVYFRMWTNGKAEISKYLLLLYLHPAHIRVPICDRHTHDIGEVYILILTRAHQTTALPGSKHSTASSEPLKSSASSSSSRSPTTGPTTAAWTSRPPTSAASTTTTSTTSRASSPPTKSTSRLSSRATSPPLPSWPGSSPTSRAAVPTVSETFPDPRRAMRR